MALRQNLNHPGFSSAPHRRVERCHVSIQRDLAERAQTEFKAIVAHVACEGPGRELSGFNRSLQHRLIELTVVVR